MFDPDSEKDEPIAVPHYDWPADDPICCLYDEVCAKQWRRVYLPMLERLNLQYQDRDAAQQPSAHGGEASKYVIDAPKLFLRLWQHREDLTRLEGAVFLTPAASGPPSCAHGGALFTALDTLMSAALFFYPSAGLPYTATLRVDYRRFVSLRPGVVRFRLGRVQRLDPRRPSRLTVHATLSSPASSGGDAELLHCTAVGQFSVPKPGAPPHAPGFVRAAAIMNATDASADAERGCEWRAPQVAVHRLPAATLAEGTRRAARAAMAAFEARAARHELEMFDFQGDFPAFFATADDGARLLPLGYPVENRMFEFAAPAAKIRTRLWWAPGELHGTMHGLVWFTQHAEGPAGRVHGGAIATAFDGVLGGTVIRGVGLGSNTTALEVQYVAPTPIGSVVLFEGCVEDGVVSSTSTDTHGSTIVAKGVFRDLAGGTVLARASSEWRRPRAMRGVSYEDAMRTFGRLSTQSVADLRNVLLQSAQGGGGFLGDFNRGEPGESDSDQLRREGNTKAKAQLGKLLRSTAKL